MEHPQPHSTQKDEEIQSNSISQSEETKEHRNDTKSEANENPSNEINCDEKPKITRKLSIENSGTRNKFSSNVPETLTPINQNSIGELTPVSVERIRGKLVVDIHMSVIEYQITL